ncbi:rRNA maturation RNase YbeY [Carnobacteriaceae bacterium zg-C25]|nr:rRNA maturation RNase YbeY [Carnobacteriaceae bacterium zg-C25]
MIVDIIDETGEVSSEHIELVEKIVQFANEYMEQTDNIECAITLVDNEAIRVINRDYRHKDVPTDVISFALDDDHSDAQIAINTDASFAHHIGDIIISVERAKEQAEDYGHSFERELGFLAVHGFLHLNGYDHMNEADEKEMFGLQNEIFEAFGLVR